MWTPIENLEGACIDKSNNNDFLADFINLKPMCAKHHSDVNDTQVPRKPPQTLIEGLFGSINGKRSQTDWFSKPNTL